MKRTLLLVVVALVLSSVMLFAEATAKDKMSAAFDVMNRGVSMRMWVAEKLAFDAGVGLSYVDDWTSFNLGGGAVIPVFDSDGINGYFTAGLYLGFGASNQNNVELSALSGTIKTGLEFEAMLTGINKNLSIGSGAYFTAGVDRTTAKVTAAGTTTSTDDTAVSVNFLTGYAITPLMVRYYF